MRALMSLIALLATTSQLWAQLTPEQYRDQVVAYSYALQSAQNWIQIKDNTLATTLTARLPNLEASGRYHNSFRDMSGAKRWSIAVEPQIIQTIYGGGVVRANVAEARINSDIARLDAQYTLLEVRYAADYAYWNLWSTTRYYHAMVSYVEIIEREMEIITRRYNEGYIPKGDMLMIASRLSEANYELTSAEQRRAISRNNLNILRGREVADSVALASISPDSMRVPRRIAREILLDQRPDYLSSQLAIDASKASTRATRGAYNPKLVGGVSGGWRTYAPNITGATYLDGAMVVELSLPIYHFGERRKATATARGYERSSELSHMELMDSIINEEANAWVTVVESRAQMSAASNSLRIAGENLEISTYSYNEGEVSIVELLQAQISWIQIYTNAIDSEYNYQVAVANYNKVVAREK